MKFGMLIAFIASLSFTAFSYFSNGEQLTAFSSFVCAGSIVSGIVYFSILFSGAKSNDFDDDGN